MIINNIDKFYKTLKDKDSFKDYKFILGGENIDIKKFNSEKIIFDGCDFYCESLTFIDLKKNLSLEFINCSFNCEVNFIKSNIEKVILNNIKSLNNLYIKNINVNVLTINGSENIFNSNIFISECNIKNNLNISNLKIKAGEFNISQINNDEKQINKLKTFIHNCEFDYFNFFDSKLNLRFDIDNLKSNFTCFKNNDFSVLHIDNSNLGRDLEFVYCDFNSYVSICLNNKLLNRLTIDRCLFNSNTDFNNSLLDEIIILESKFTEKVSFEGVSTNVFKIHQVQFLNSAYFDDLNINNNKVIENWDRKTLRAIKRELVNSHNQIDYLRFKAYELEAYNKENGKNWKDSFILKLNSCSSKNGLDWFRSVLFTIIISICFFYLYTVIEVYDLSRNPFEYSFISEERVKEYFFFLNPSDFDYHFNKLKNLKSNIGSTIIFLIAKVFITYGIYQTVQAFRKFGINGG